jgi:hypothetical protein
MHEAIRSIDRPGAKRASLPAPPRLTEKGARRVTVARLCRRFMDDHSGRIRD